MNKNVEVIGLIYKSTDYLEFLAAQLKSRFCKVDGWDVGVRIIANDATQEVLSALEKINIPYTIYNDPKPDDYYLNRVYRCHNFGAKTSQYDNICFVNSDILLSEKWLDNLLFFHDGINIPVSRLVESGKMPSGAHAISNFFGTHPRNIMYKEWEQYAKEIKQFKPTLGGLYGPVVFNKQRFIDAGMYPEGNIYEDGVAGSPNGQVVKSADDFFFHDILEPHYGMRHITAFDSVVYHIQEGEKDE